MSQTQIPFTAATNTAPRAAAAAAELPPVPPVFLPVGDLKGKLEYSTLVDPTARNAKVACVFCGSSPC